MCYNGGDGSVMISDSLRTSIRLEWSQGFTFDGGTSGPISLFSVPTCIALLGTFYRSKTLIQILVERKWPRDDCKTPTH